MKQALDTIGKTPVVELKKINKTKSRIFVKLDNMNPSGSIKDVMVHYIMERAEERGELKPGKKVIELTSGNTGISLSMLCAIKGYKFTAVMPANMSKERIEIMKAFGAEVVLTPAKDDMKGAMKKYIELVKKNKNAWLPRQFENNDNVKSHEDITGKEIIRQTEKRDVGKIDVFVAGIGTGGTLIGVGKCLRKKHKDVRIVGVEPAECAVLCGCKLNPHGIQGIGEGFIPKIVDKRMIDEIIKIRTEDARKMTNRIAKEEGIFVGISSGANLLAALKIAKMSRKRLNIVTVFPDSGDRYLTTGIFS